MKKWIYTAAACLLCFAFFYKPAKRPEVKQLAMHLPSELPLEKICGKNRDKAIASIASFPQKSYQLFDLPAHGFFYIDQIDDVIKSFLRKGKTWEKHIQNLIPLYAHCGTTVLDIGAHIGTHTLALSEAVGPEGRVISFEPQPKIFRELFLNMAANKRSNIEFYQAAASDKNGKIELSPLRVGNEGGTALKGGSESFAETVTIDSLNLEDVSLIKIDAEGMEDQVIDGARATIVREKPAIIIEIMGGYDFGSAPPDVRKKINGTIEKLEALGYRVTQIRDHDWLATPSLRQDHAGDLPPDGK